MIQKFQRTEQIYIPRNGEKTNTINLKNFIIKNFEIPDEDLERICEFISNENQLEKIIFELPHLIQNEISYDKLQIKFYDEFQEDYPQLEVTVLTSLDITTSLKVEGKLEEKLYESYENNSADKILIIME